MKKRFILSLISLASILALVLAWFTAAKTAESITKERLIQPQTFVAQWVQELSSLCPEDLTSLQDRAFLVGYSYLQITTKNNATPWVELRLPEAMNWELPHFKEIPSTLAFSKFYPVKSNSEMFDIYSPFYLDHSPDCEALQKADGMTVRAADLQGPDGYVRVGYSAELINLQITVQLLQIGGITLFALLVYSLAVWLIARRLYLVYPVPIKSETSKRFYPLLSVPSMPNKETSPLIREKSTDATLDTAQTGGGNTASLSDLSADKINQTIRPQPLSLVEPSAQKKSDEAAHSSPTLSTSSEKNVASASLILDDVSKQAQLDGQNLTLTPKEFDILKLLASQPGRVFSNEEILKNVWPEGSFASSQDVKQYVYFLRRKIEKDQQNPQRLVTVRGFGYKLNP